jgi:hypothetical protein
MIFCVGSLPNSLKEQSAKRQTIPSWILDRQQKNDVEIINDGREGPLLPQLAEKWEEKSSCGATDKKIRQNQRELI